MNQSLNKILPNSISQKNQEDAKTSHKEEIREEKKKLNELLEPIQQWTTLEVNQDEAMHLDMKQMPLSQGDRQDMTADFMDSPKINTEVI